jgi:hypothetical protein
VTDVQVLVATAGVSGGTLRGTVRDEQGRPTGIATVYAFPAERGLWRAGYVDNRRFRAVQPDEVDGSYAVPGLPAGDYHVVALGGGAREGWQHATSLQGFAAIAVQIPVSKGGTLTQPLVVKR